MFSLTFHNSSSESISSHKATDEKAVVAAGTKDEVDGVELEEVEVDANNAELEAEVAAEDVEAEAVGADLDSYIFL